MVPQLLKRFQSAQQRLNDLGFTSGNIESARKDWFDISNDELHAILKDSAESIKTLGKQQKEQNEIKNRLKHGKAILGTDLTETPQESIVYLTWKTERGSPVLYINRMETTVEQLEIATILAAKLYIRSVDLLLLFIIQYHPNQVTDTNLTSNIE